MAKAPNPSRVARAKARHDSSSVRIRVDGDELTFWPTEITGRQDMECRQVTGLTVTECLSLLGDRRVSIEAVCVAVWLARVQSGDTVALVDVLDSVSTGSDIDIMEGDDSSPPESGER